MAGNLSGPPQSRGNLTGQLQFYDNKSMSTVLNFAEAAQHKRMRTFIPHALSFLEEGIERSVLGITPYMWRDAPSAEEEKEIVRLNISLQIYGMCLKEISGTLPRYQDLRATTHIMLHELGIQLDSPKPEADLIFTDTYWENIVERSVQWVDQFKAMITPSLRSTAESEVLSIKQALFALPLLSRQQPETGLSDIPSPRLY